MKALKDSTLDQFEQLALEGARHMKAYFAYEGDNPRYYQKAKLGAVVISGYGRMRQSETGRMAVEVASQRILPVAVEPHRIGDGK